MLQSRSSDFWLGPLLSMILEMLFLVLAGLWLVSAWLTRLLFAYVLDPLTGDLFARHDRLLVVTSALLWAALFLLLLFPQAVAVQSADTWQVYIGTLLLALAWGLSIGVKLVINQEVDDVAELR